MVFQKLRPFGTLSEKKQQKNNPAYYGSGHKGGVFTTCLILYCTQKVNFGFSSHLAKSYIK